ncbi:hypothetical protein KPP03845_106072 [Streptomyces xanthophaeus]|uniref:hypothetical protein n=1 Tax=Streptomyces xanthophaeus TaxID=67385 RepID=UPI00233EF868|nr:hypothetical protein [Streptomyces xanthophaeus]WCD89650.1 hypothetical protein KPP03845_106072 [Streptomyces xanthophaeus]
MTAWQYFAGAGLVAALCPLHGHVAVAGDGHGRGARIDLCVPAGQPRPPGTRPSVKPSVPALVPGTGGPTVHHPGSTPRPPGPTAPAARPAPAAPVPGGPAAEPGAAGAVEDHKPAEPAPGPAAEPVRAAAEAPERPLPAAAVARVSAFHVRPYRSVAVERRNPAGMSTLMLMVVVTTPAVLAAAALRPRSKGRG